MGLYGIMDEIIAGSMGSGWWFQPSPLKNDGLRQLGRLSPNYLKNLGVNMCKSPTQSHTNSKWLVTVHNVTSPLYPYYITNSILHHQHCWLYWFVPPFVLVLSLITVFDVFFVKRKIRRAPKKGPNCTGDSKAQFQRSSRRISGANRWGTLHLDALKLQETRLQGMVLKMMTPNSPIMVVYLPLWKIWKSFGMLIPNTWKVIKFMFQTTNQSHAKSPFLRGKSLN